MTAGDDSTETTAAAETTTTAAAAETTTTAAATETTEAMSTEPVIVCELAYFTGEFAAYGPSLTADVEFPISQVINNDPPLGREWQLISEDIGTPGEAQAARICLEQHGAEIVVSQAHGYRQYRCASAAYEGCSAGTSMRSRTSIPSASAVLTAASAASWNPST